jgi:glycosyltransferase involved in cell wall biosynthesis
VLTWFHFSPKDPRLMRLKENQKKINVIHVVTKLAQQSLIEHGIKKEKVVLIPLGIDLSKFKPVHEKEKASLRKQYDLPPERLIIGSFQKDGEGWDEGLTPKLIKGPDVFISVMQNLKKYRPFVLLTGPARGYVKKQLTRLKIDYRHIYAVNINEIAHLYQTLDLYLISSRLEGGPKSIVECLASGVPLVSTRVGMAPDVICDGVSGFLSASENAKALTQNLRRLIDDFALRKSFIINGLKTVKKYDEQLINRQYFEKIYQKLL